VNPKKLFSLSILTVGVLYSSASFAATLYVATTGTNSGGCTNSGAPCVTIQYAVEQAGTGDTINIAAGTYTENDIDLTANETLTFQGAAAETTIINGNNADTIFAYNGSTSSETTYTFNKLTLQNGSSASGGGLHINESGFTKRVNIAINDVVFKNNTATQLGGAIRLYTCKDVTLNRVTFSNNSTTTTFGGGGAIQLFVLNSLTLNNVTFSGNSTVATAGNYGGGAILLNSVTTVTINNTTFANNTANAGGAFYAIDASTLTFSNTILDNNTPNNCHIGGTATFTTAGNNISSDASCNNFIAATDQFLTDSLLDDLADNGGEVPTMALLTGSPAIDAGNNVTCLTIDARSESRPDDGDGDGTATCDVGAYEIVCGDGLIDGAEACEDGNGINTDTCTNACTTATCGDGIIRTGVETCDNAGGNSDTVANACRTDCISATCGDGITDTGEGCDDGNAVNTDSCRNTCALATCGDGLLDTGEACDNGVSNSNAAANACRSTCVAAVCGDGVLDTGEACDNGVSNSNATANACRTTCVSAVCGDGVIDTGEACDDGNNSDEDACLNSCALAACGDGIVETDAEECDAGDANSDTDANACRTTCVAPVCGDGVLDSTEICDDDNASSQDGCDSTCVFEAYDELAADNPSINFSTLTQGESLVVSAPGVTTAAISSQLLLATADETCTCVWTVTPSDFGSLSSSATCETSLTILGTTQANLGVSVVCATSASSRYNQTLFVAEASASPASELASSSGCTLSQQAAPNQSVNWLWGSLLVSLVVGRKTLSIALAKKNS